jgi:predicted RNA binding protein YcfA (HicA-like mRNA interferase family)
MPQLPVISGKNFIVFLELLGFKVVRINGSHHRLKHPDGRITTVPVHKNEDLPRGLIRKIIRDDLGLEPDQFVKLYRQVK